MADLPTNQSTENGEDASARSKVSLVSLDEPEAMRTLFEELYPEIKRIARARLASVGGVTGLNATALVHEGFMRMAEREGFQGQTRLQFFAYVGKLLRSVLIDHIRTRDAQKRGGGVTLLTLSHAGEAPSPWLHSVDLIDLDRALTSLRTLDERLYQIVEMHVFSGLNSEEIGLELRVTSRTVNREIAKAKALLSEALGVAHPIEER